MRLADLYDTLAKAVTPRAAYETTGEALGTVHHGGRAQFDRVDPARLQSRDRGYYGKGFYATTKPDVARSYGPRVSSFRLPGHARVLTASLRHSEAHPELQRAVEAHSRAVSAHHLHQAGIPEQQARGMIEDDIDHLRSSPTSWTAAVNSFAEHHDYAAVQHSPSEVVIRHHQALTAVHRGAGRRAAVTPSAGAPSAA